MNKNCFYLLLVTICILVLFFLPFSLSATEVTKTQDKRIKNNKPQDQIAPEQDLNLNKRELKFLRNHAVIRVGSEEVWAPFDFNEQGRPKGYAIDYLEILADKLGISIKYINGYSWSELLELFKKGKIDILPALWISESRKNYMLFTEPFLKLPYVIVAKSAEDSIEDFSDLKGKIVAVARDYKQEEVLRNNYPQVNTYLVKNALEGLKAVSYNKVDAYIGYRGTVDYLIAKNFFTDLET